MDNPTVNFAYRHGGEYNDLIPPDNKRYLSGFGRGGAIEEFELEYLPVSRRLYATGAGNRAAAGTERDARKLWGAVMQFDAGGEKPNKTDLFAHMKWTTKGSGAEKANRAYRHALDSNWVTVESGAKNAKLHSPGPNRPDDGHFGLKLNDIEDGGEG